MLFCDKCHSKRLWQMVLGPVFGTLFCILFAKVFYKDRTRGKERIIWSIGIVESHFKILFKRCPKVCAL